MNNENPNLYSDNNEELNSTNAQQTSSEGNAAESIPSPERISYSVPMADSVEPDSIPMSDVESPNLSVNNGQLDSTNSPVSADSTDATDNTEKSAINMEFKPRKTPTWLIVLVCVISVLYVAVSSILIITIMNKSPNQPTPSNASTSSPEQSAQSAPALEDVPIEEHLTISESKRSLGARTAEGSLTVKEISEKVRPSVVGVACETQGAFSSGSFDSVGSGIIMTADGYIITNNHVIEGASKIQVILDDGTTYGARLIGSDARSDLAVIKIEASDLPAAEFGDSDQLEQGDPAVAIGNPAGLQLQNTVTYGIISAINRDIIVDDRAMTLIQTDASINPGNSGGPLVNEFGQVIGINTIKVGVSYYEGLGFAIPMNTVKPIVDELISVGYIKGRPSIGITGMTISESDYAYYGLPAGLLVEYVHPQSDAFKKGLRRGDVITHLNGEAFTSTAEIRKLRDNYKAGDTITLTVYRNSKTADIEVILMDEALLPATESYSN
ncbi:MAG: trypsin-like peptidase domain-containing protein [Oscillospiraceae bacterium]|nr:trypsin-like peptidase domain-containing protein [Oscillospiraceae bacterium]